MIRTLLFAKIHRAAVTAANDAPTADDQSVTTPEDTAKAITLRVGTSRPGTVLIVR